MLISRHTFCRYNKKRLFGIKNEKLFCNTRRSRNKYLLQLPDVFVMKIFKLFNRLHRKYNFIFSCFYVCVSVIGECFCIHSFVCTFLLTALMILKIVKKMEILDFFSVLYLPGHIITHFIKIISKKKPSDL